VTAPFPPAGPGEPSFPPSSVLRSRYDIPSCMSVSLCLRLRIPREPWAFVFALALPAISKATVGPGALFNRCSVIRVLSRGYKRDLSGSQATHPAPLPCSETPAESVILALPDFPMLPPVPTRRRLQRAHDFEANTRLRYPLSTLHERRCRHPCKTRFRLAGSAFAGRASNPLGHKERFQATSILLSRAYPDASWAHVRRRFYELATAGPAPIASEALQRIAALYQIEAKIRSRSADERRTVRLEKSRPILDDLEPWLRAKLALISQKTKLAEAIRYALSRWAGLSRFVDDGRIEIDSNVVERAIRPIALNRKNALFAGSDGGAEHWAIIASLIETCMCGWPPRCKSFV
jgi:Transposase IS66 family